MNSRYRILFCAAFLAAVALTGIPLHAQSQWEATNGPYGGRVFSLYADANQQVYAGTDDGGLYRSSDNGVTWTYVGLAQSTVRTITRHPDGRLLAGLQRGLMISSDDGATWRNTQAPQHGFGLAVTSAGHIFIGGWDGLHKSTDDGATWDPVDMKINSPRIQELFISNAGTLFAGLYLGGLWRSSDNGLSWVSANSAFDNATVEVIVQRGNVLYAASDRTVVYSSTDDGLTWAATSSGQEPARVLSLVFVDDQTLIAGNEFGFIYRSTDGGASWSIVFSDPVNANIYSLVRTGSGTLLAGTNWDGIYRSTDNGVTWSPSNQGLTNLDVMYMARNSKGEIVISTGGYGSIRKTTDDGSSWSVIPNPTNGTAPLAFGPSDVLYISTYYGPFHTSDNGVTWIPDTAGAPRMSATAFAVSPAGDIALGGANGEIYLRKYNETQWTDHSGKAGTSHIHCLTYIGTSLFMGSNGDGLYRTKDNGTTFEALTTGMPETIVYFIATNPGDATYAGTFGSVYRSTDEGDSWNWYYNIPNGTVTGMAFTTIPKAIIIAIHSSGIRFLLEGSTQWERYNTRLTSLLVTSLFTTASGALIAGTEGSGLFRSQSLPVAVERTAYYPEELSLLQNFPNPFRNETMIRYAIPEGMHVRLTIHDALGREVRELRNGYHARGEYTVTFHGASLQSGPYFIRLIGPTVTRTRMMNLMR